MKKVAVGIIVQEFNHQKKYLLVSSTRDFGEFTGFYYPPAGHMEKHESEQATILRELKEELGYNAEIIKKITQTPGDIKDQITYWWLCKIIGGVLKIQKEEIADVRWFTGEEIRHASNIWPATKKVFLDFILDRV